MVIQKKDIDDYIQNLIKERYDLLDKDELLQDNTVKIFTFIKDHKDILCFEEILEIIVHTGRCPSLLYDDNGNWCICEEGSQDMEEVKFINHYIEDLNSWKPTIREALYYYLNKNIFILL